MSGLDGRPLVPNDTPLAYVLRYRGRRADASRWPVDARVLAMLAVVTTIAWCLGYASVLVVTALPRRPRARAAGAAVEPAVAALLCPPNGKVPGRAVAATLLDLAARGAVRLAAGPDGQWWVTPAAATPPGLHPHERLISIDALLLDFLRSV